MTSLMRVITPVIALLAALVVQVPVAQSSNASNVVVSAGSTVKTVKITPTARMIRPLGPVNGMRPSAWTGKYYYSKWELVRRCIVKRESEGQYSVVSHVSSSAGAYQFIKFWRPILAHLLGKPYLANIPINHWSRVDQDHAFWTIWNNGKGRSNWGPAGARYNCF
jgi:hypothetical protein